MAFRISYRWVQQSRKLGSWTENFWLDTDDATLAETAGRALLVPLNRAKARQVYCPYFRYSKVGVFRASEQVLIPGAKPGSGTSFDADYPTTKLQLQFRSAGGRTTQWFGGLVDEWISNSGNWVPIGSATNDLNGFFAALTGPSYPWSVRILDPARPTFLVKNIDGATGTVTTNVNTFPADAKVRIKGVRGMTQANDVWRITIINNTSFTLNGWLPTTVPFEKGDPTVRQQLYTLQKITLAKVVGSTSHKVGKMPDQLSGQAKPR